jgi:hypothetical protein
MRPGSHITGSPPARDMSQPDIEIAALQRAASPGDTMTSPYLDHIRSTRDIIEQLIVAREIELAKTTTAAQRRRLEAGLTLLRDELARIDGRKAERTAGCNQRRVAPR